jgi:hypothetical protein
VLQDELEWEEVNLPESPLVNLGGDESSTRLDLVGDIVLWSGTDTDGLAACAWEDI